MHELAGAHGGVVGDRHADRRRQHERTGGCIAPHPVRRDIDLDADDEGFAIGHVAQPDAAGRTVVIAGLQRALVVVDRKVAAAGIGPEKQRHARAIAVDGHAQDDEGPFEPARRQARRLQELPVAEPDAQGRRGDRIARAGDRQVPAAIAAVGHARHRRGLAGIGRGGVEIASRLRVVDPRCRRCGDHQQRGAGRDRPGGIAPVDRQRIFARLGQFHALLLRVDPVADRIVVQQQVPLCGRWRGAFGTAQVQGDAVAQPRRFGQDRGLAGDRRRYGGHRLIDQHRTVGVQQPRGLAAVIDPLDPVEKAALDTAMDRRRRIPTIQHHQIVRAPLPFGQGEVAVVVRGDDQPHRAALARRLQVLRARPFQIAQRRLQRRGQKQRPHLEQLGHIGAVARDGPGRPGPLALAVHDQIQRPAALRVGRRLDLLGHHPHAALEYVRALKRRDDLARGDRRKRGVHQHAPDCGFVRHLTLSSSEWRSDYPGKARTLQKAGLQRTGLGSGLDASAHRQFRGATGQRHAVDPSAYGIHASTIRDLRP
ncbi:hypothetical protein Pden_1993 [Paracoccus denitrificans PD1222]|uniref:Uncharacterized protein n=1 Tax=Paracoccus denitrificans (strain Pd 1222) TaxID=318586 RepID=A1B3J1_PARDP|nr:hypothetical protein Pden_1993 [Paracoccus denitrificans PD1222]